MEYDLLTGMKHYNKQFKLCIPIVPGRPALLR